MHFNRLTIFINLCLILVFAQSSRALAPHTQIKEQKESIRLIGEKLVAHYLTSNSFNYMVFGDSPPFLPPYFVRGDVAVLFPLAQHLPLIVLYHKGKTSEDQFLPEWHFPIRQTGILKPPFLTGSEVYFHVYDTLSVLKELDKTRTTETALEKIFTSLGINPKWITSDFGFIIGNKSYYSRLFGFNRGELYRSVAPLFYQYKDGFYPDFPEGTYNCYSIASGANTTNHSYLFHDFFHNAFFTKIVGPAKRNKFDKLMIEHRDFIDELFKESGGVNAVYEDYLFRPIDEKNHSKLELFTYSQIALSELFSRLAAIYYDIKNKERGLSKREDIVLDVFRANAEKLPKPIEDFFDELELIDPNWKSSRSVFHSLESILNHAEETPLSSYLEFESSI